MSTSFSQTWDLSGLNFVQPCAAATVCRSSHAHQSCGIWKALFPWSFPSSLALRIFLSPLANRCLSHKGNQLVHFINMYILLTCTFINMYLPFSSPWICHQNILTLIVVFSGCCLWLKQHTAEDGHVLRPGLELSNDPHSAAPPPSQLLLRGSSAVSAVWWIVVTQRNPEVAYLHGQDFKTQKQAAYDGTH